MSIEKGELIGIRDNERKLRKVGAGIKEGFNSLLSGFSKEELLPSFTYMLTAIEVPVSGQEDIWVQLFLMDYSMEEIAHMTKTNRIEVEATMMRIEEELRSVDWKKLQEDLFEDYIEELPVIVPELVPDLVTRDEEVNEVMPDENSIGESPLQEETGVVKEKDRKQVSDGGHVPFTPLGVGTLLEVLQGDTGLFSEVESTMDWRNYALCAQTDPEAFFPEKGGSTRAAKKICARCDVGEECLDYALNHDERFGIWGGLSERQRRKLKKRIV